MNALRPADAHLIDWIPPHVFQALKTMIKSRKIFTSTLGIKGRPMVAFFQSLYTVFLVKNISQTTKPLPQPSTRQHRNCQTIFLAKAFITTFTTGLAGLAPLLGI